MDMKTLFEDFKMYVDSMDESAIKRSIAQAMEHTSNSYLLDGISEKSQGAYDKSTTQSVSATAGMKGVFSFCSVEVSSSKNSHILSRVEVSAA